MLFPAFNGVSRTRVIRILPYFCLKHPNLSLIILLMSSTPSSTPPQQRRCYCCHSSCLQDGCQATTFKEHQQVSCTQAQGMPTSNEHQCTHTRFMLHPLSPAQAQEQQSHLCKGRVPLDTIAEDGNEDVSPSPNNSMCSSTDLLA